MIRTPARFVILCEATYGSRWRSALNDTIGISPRTVWNYEHGAREVPESLWQEICSALCERLAQLSAVHAEYCRADCAAAAA